MKQLKHVIAVCSPCISPSSLHGDCAPPPELPPALMLSQRHCCLEGTSGGAWLLGLGVWSRSLQTWVCTDAQDSWSGSRVTRIIASSVKRTFWASSSYTSAQTDKSNTPASYVGVSL